MPPERPGEGALPKSFILATAGGRPAPEFLIIEGRPGAGGGSPKNLIVGGLSGLPPHRNAGSLAFFRSRRRAGEGRSAFPKSFILASVQNGSRANDATIPDACRRVPTRSGFPKNLIFGTPPMTRKRRLAGFPGYGTNPQSEQGRGRFPQILHTCVCQQLKRRSSGRCQISVTGRLRFHIHRSDGSGFPKNLIIPPQIPHFIPQILHSCPSRFPRFLIGVPKSFTIKTTSL